MVVLDLFCGAGGAAMGYHRAGFEVIGVDLHPQPHFPFRFIQADALTFPIKADLVHASPPCQGYSLTQRIHNRDHPKLISPLRGRLRSSGVPFVIENVVGAPLEDPILLCGSMFGLRTYRHRLFECSFPVKPPFHPPHCHKVAQVGRRPKEGEFFSISGHFPDVKGARLAMEIDWMTRDELAQAIPPAFTHWIGMQFLKLPKLPQINPVCPAQIAA